MHHFARRARLHPEFETIGLLGDPSVLVDLRRPADVLVDGGGWGVRVGPVRRFDKVINALGADHYEASLRGPQCAAEAYREAQQAHLDTTRLCAERRIGYELLVFTRQGGVERHAEVC